MTTTAPIGLGSFFNEHNDSDGDNDDDKEEAFSQIYENQNLVIGGENLEIRQFSFHPANANQVWPGTFRLAEYIKDHATVYGSGRILEIGAATGALAIFLIRQGFDVITSDINDGGDVYGNIIHNFELNSTPSILHVACTWGTSWSESIIDQGLPQHLVAANSFKYIVASDILLYVSAYPALVQTLTELFDGGSVQEFLMSWNRRIAASSIFFDLMKEAKFQCEHLGKCIFSFTRPSTPQHDNDNNNT